METIKLQDKLQEIRDKLVPCNCDEGYTSRGLTAPDCPQCATGVDEAMIAFAAYCCDRQRESDAEAATWDSPTKDMILSDDGTRWLVNQSDISVDKPSILNNPLITDEL